MEKQETKVDCKCVVTLDFVTAYDQVLVSETVFAYTHPDTEDGNWSGWMFHRPTQTAIRVGTQNTTCGTISNAVQIQIEQTHRESDDVPIRVFAEYVQSLLHTWEEDIPRKLSDDAYVYWDHGIKFSTEASVVGVYGPVQLDLAFSEFREDSVLDDHATLDTNNKDELVLVDMNCAVTTVTTTDHFEPRLVTPKQNLNAPIRFEKHMLRAEAIARKFNAECELYQARCALQIPLGSIGTLACSTK